MNRRHFVVGLAAEGAVASLPCFGQISQAKLEIGSMTVNIVARDFTGLSYESAQLANPEFFSAANRELIELFRGLSLSGNLRLGGGSSEFTTYSAVEPAGPLPFEVFGPDTS